MDTFDLDIAGAEFTRSMIYEAIKERNHHKVLAAIHAEENVHLTDPEFKSTYLHLIVNLAESTSEERFVPMVYQLSNSGIDVNAVDYKGQTALDIAINRELMELMTALLRVGVDPADKDYKGLIRDFGSPFEYEIINTLEKYEPGMWNAVKDESQSLIHMLANSWCRIAVVKDGLSLIQYAQQSGKPADLIALLEDYEPTLEFVHATLAGDEKRMLELLMDSKHCDPHIMDISHQERWSHPLSPRSLRDTAIAMGHTHVIHLLPESDEDDTITLVQPRSQSPVHFFRPTRFQRSASLNDASPHQPSASHQDTLTLQERCYYFHEVDTFVHPYTLIPKKPGSLRTKKRQSLYRDYGSTTNFLSSDSNTKVKSKMCVIS